MVYYYASSFILFFLFIFFAIDLIREKKNIKRGIIYFIIGLYFLMISLHFYERIYDEYHEDNMKIEYKHFNKSTEKLGKMLYETK